MARTAGELKNLKAEVEALEKKLSELSEEELKEVTGGYYDPSDITPPDYDFFYNSNT